MIRSMKKLLSVSLCASLLTGTAALGTLSANAAEGPMPPFVQTEVFDFFNVVHLAVPDPVRGSRLTAWRRLCG